jgi:hypothetical protein
MKKYLIWVFCILSIVGILLFLNGIGTRSGVSREQVSETLPGDSIIPDPWISIDRAGTLPATNQTAWPWVQQLGKDRGGWYAPEWLENTLHEHSATTTLPQFQNLKVGDIVPDWGGGTLTVLAISPNNYVVYGSHSANAATSTPWNFTWALVLENDTTTSSSFHLRLRLQRPTHGFGQYIPPSLPGFIDYATDVVMFAGLQEKFSHTFSS